jgi:hypothetical protein
MTLEPTGHAGDGSASGERDWGARPVGPGWGPELIAEKIRAPSSPQETVFRCVEPARREGRPGAMVQGMRLVSLAAIVLLVAACTSAGGNASESPSPSGGGIGAIEHATGSTDVLLRFEVGGGFVAPGFLATEAPIFTLYGDGTVIVRNPAQDPPPSVGSVSPLRPFRIVRLNEEQLQKVLEDALVQGGLGQARTDYPDNQIADAPTAVFTVNAGGIAKRVSIYALGIDVANQPDAQARVAFADLAARLEAFDGGGGDATGMYSPDRYRGILQEGQAGGPDVKAWPWITVSPGDFVPASDPNAFRLPSRVMSVGAVEALGINPYQGGFQGLSLVGPGDGKVYSFSLRPLLPDESR